MTIAAQQSVPVSGQSRPRIILGVAWALLATIGLMVLSVTGTMPQAPDTWTYDWRMAFCSGPGKERHKDIAVVLLDDNSLDQYPYMVVDRGLVANVVRGLDESQVKAIGLDFLFVRPTESRKDEALLAAIRSVETPTVAGGMPKEMKENKPRWREFEASFLDRAGPRLEVGDVQFWGTPDRWTTGDRIVRFLANPEGVAPERKSFAELLAKIGGVEAKLATGYIDWLRPASGSESPFTVFRVPSHAPGDGPRAVIPAEWRPALKGKIVLVGAGFPDRDLHLTPLSVMDNSQFHGVMIHAQILAQLLEERSLHVFPPWQEALLVFALAGLGYALGWRAKLNRHSFIAYLGGVVVLGVLGVLMLMFLKFIIPTSSLLLGWVAGVTGGHYSGWALRKLARLGLA